MSANTTSQSDYINKLFNFYDSKGYYYRYSGSVGLTVVVIIVFFLINSYLFIRINTNYYKRNWVSYRCNPSIMPFAGIINAPPDKDKLEYTFDNFSFCLNKILDDIVSFAMAPIIFAIHSISLVYKALIDMIKEIVRMFDYLRTMITDVIKRIFGNIMNLLIPFQYMIIKMKTLFGKIAAAQATTLYTFLATYMSILTSMKITYEFIVTFVFVFVGIIVAVWAIWVAFLGLNPVPAVIASALTVVLIVFLGLLSNFAVFLQDILGVAGSPLPGVPGKPHICFKSSTPIKTKDYGNIPISNIKPNTYLDDGSLVTAVLKLDAKNQQVYKIFDEELGKYIHVTSDHRILYKNHETGEIKWVLMKEHPNAERDHSFNDDYVYCLNTNSKQINIGSHCFKDWDDLDEDSYDKLQNVIYYSFENYPSKEDLNIIPQSIYPFFEGGFTKNTKITLLNGKQIPINKVKTGDVLSNNATVYGLVKIKNNFNIYKYSNNLECTSNCYVKGKNKILHVDEVKNYRKNTAIKREKEEIDYLYHLLTDNHYFTCEGNEFTDYNNNLDLFL